MFRGSVNGTGLLTPFARFPFTSPPARHRVPSRFNWTLKTRQTLSPFYEELQTQLQKEHFLFLSLNTKQAVTA